MRRAWLPAVLLLLSVAACGDDEVTGPFAACDTLLTSLATPAATAPSATSPAATAPAGTAPSATAPAGTAPAATAPTAISPAVTAPAATDAPSSTVLADLPDLRLQCFAGGDEIALRALRGPAVINLWASWCQPCRDELPVVQQLADRTAGKLLVLGVDTGDDRAKGAEFATDRAVTMPTLFDPDKKLLNAVGRITLPVTVFVDASGKSYVHPLPMDAAGLAEQTRKHTGVTVTP